MKVPGHGRQSEASILTCRRQLIEIAHEQGYTVPRNKRRPRAETVVCPQRLRGQIWVNADQCSSRSQRVQLLRRKQRQSLMVAGASFAGSCIGLHLGRRIQAFYCLLDRHDGHRLNKGRDRRTRGLHLGYQRSPSCAKSSLSYQIASAR